MDLSDMIISKLHAINWISIKSSENRIRSSRPNSAFMYKIKGKTLYQSASKIYVGDASHIVFLPCGANYKFKIQELGPCVGIELDMFPLDIVEPLIFNVQKPEEMARIMQKLLSTWNRRGAGFKCECMGLVYEMMHQLELAAASEYICDQTHQLILPSVNYLEQHYMEPNLRNADLAQKSQISEIYFRKIFTNKYHTSPQRYLTNLRIQKAQELLLGDYDTIESIAMQVGYNSIQNFCKAFHHITGMTPTEFSRRGWANTADKSE